MASKAVGNNLRGRGGPTGPSGPSSSVPSAPAARRVAKPSDDHQQAGLKIVNGEQELSILDNKVTIGRRKECDICLTDPLVSGNHCEITNGFVLDTGSTNGTQLNGTPLKAHAKKMLKVGDRLQIGDRILRIETGPPRSEEDGQDLSRSKKFIGGIGGKSDGADGKDAEKDAESKVESDEDAKLTVEELMDKEFGKIIGHEGLKKQLRQFHKKVQLDQIRQNAGKEKDKKRLYHMIFSGPPGTGPYTFEEQNARMKIPPWRRTPQHNAMLTSCSRFCFPARAFPPPQVRPLWPTWCLRS